MKTVIFAALTPEGPTNFKMTEAYRQTYYPDWPPILGTAETHELPSLEELLAAAREPEDDPQEAIEPPMKSQHQS